MIEVVLIASAVAALAALFGAAPVLALTPEPWRPWWPMLLPIAGLAAAGAILYPLSLVLPVGRAALPAVAVAAALAAMAWRRRVPLPRPSGWCLGALAVAVAAASLAYWPSLRAGEPLAPGVVNIDAIYYAAVDEWLQDHRLLDAVPRVSDDGFFAPAREIDERHLRVGVDLFGATAAVLLRALPADVLPALIAFLGGLSGLAAALFLLALRAPAPVALAATALVALRADQVRIGLDAYVAQAAGLALVPAALGALVLALAAAESRRAVVLAALLAGGLAAYYTEYLPFLVLAGALVLILGLALPRRLGLDGASNRVTLLRTAAAVAVATLVLQPVGVVRGITSLISTSGLTGEVIVPFYGAREVLALLTGPFSVVRADPFAVTEPVAGWIYWVAAAAAAAAVARVLAARDAIGLLLGAALAAAAGFAVHQGVVAHYSYGLYKVWGLAAVFVLAAAAAALATRRVALRALVAAVLGLLLAVNVVGSARIAKASGTALNAAQPDDRRLAGLRLPGGVALEGTDFLHAPDARQHWGVYYLRFGADAPVSFALGDGSYFTMHTDDLHARTDRRFRAGYRWVVSLLPSITHDSPVRRVGGTYAVFARDAVDLLAVGQGWLPPQPSADGRPVMFTSGTGELLASALRAARVRLRLEVVAPAPERELRVAAAGREVAARRVPPDRVVSWTTPAFDLPAGVSTISITDGSRPEGAPGAGLVSVRAEVVG